jgi:hypothetical protein
MTALHCFQDLPCHEQDQKQGALPSGLGDKANGATPQVHKAIPGSVNFESLSRAPISWFKIYLSLWAIFHFHWVPIYHKWLGLVLFYKPIPPLQQAPKTFNVEYVLICTIYKRTIGICPRCWSLDSFCVKYKSEGSQILSIVKHTGSKHNKSSKLKKWQSEVNVVRWFLFLKQVSYNNGSSYAQWLWIKQTINTQEKMQ